MKPLKQKLQPLQSKTVLLISIVAFLILFLSACKKNYQPEQIENQKANPNLFTVRFNGQDVQVLKKGDFYYFYDDVFFDQKAFDSLKALNDKRSTTSPRSTYTTRFNSYWPMGVVYYSISPAFNSYPTDRQKIINAINHWRNNTSLTFVERTNQPNYIRFEVVSNQDYAGASMGIGMMGGYQYINLDVTDPFTTGTVIHEIGHAIGLYHEQSRTDRNNFIVINTQNMTQNEQTFYQFRTYTQNNEPGAQNGTFDFESIMLYGSYAGSRFTPWTTEWFNNPVMTRLDNSTFEGLRNNLSIGDIQGISLLYGPPFARMNYYETAHEENSGGASEWERRDGMYVIELFLDPLCTIPFTLPDPKRVNYFVDNIPHSSTIAAGQNSIVASHYVYEYRSDYGNVVIYENGYAKNGKNGFWR